jgi:hypothetical protein
MSKNRQGSAFNPETQVRKIEFKVETITKDRAIAFVSKYHYSPVMPVQTKYFLGFFDEGKLKGVLTLGYGVQPRHTINKILPTCSDEIMEHHIEYKGKKSKKIYHNPLDEWYFEIGKMCMSDDMLKNSETQMLSATVKWLKRHSKKTKFLYTMADGIMGKHGGVYQSFSMYYGGMKSTEIYRSKTGERIHPRSSAAMCKEDARIEGIDKRTRLSISYMESKGIQHVHGYMVCYMIPLNPEGKRLIAEAMPFERTSSTCKWQKGNYPKFEDLRWFIRVRKEGDNDYNPKTEKVEINQPEFNYDNIEYNPQLKKRLYKSNIPNLEDILSE